MGGQLEQVKTNIITLYEKLKEMMLGDNKYISALRAKIVLFSDIYVDGEAALQETKMYDLPGEEKALSDYVQGIQLLGGGDEPESGLEALGMAMRSTWNKDPMKKRDVIFLWSDASALSLTPEAWPDYVPSGLYRSLESMTDAWRNDTRNPDGKRLILFAPEVEPWSTIAATWNDVFIYPDYAAGTNMDFDTVLEVIIEGL